MPLAIALNFPHPLSAKQRLIGIMLATAILSTPLVPATAGNSSTAHQLSALQTHGDRAGGLNAQQWFEVARIASSRKDSDGARAATAMAEQAVGENHRLMLTSLVKNAIKAVLKHGRHLLPKKIRPWADKLHDLVDYLDESTELAIATYLTNQGIPPDVAREAARWIMTFV